MAWSQKTPPSRVERAIADDLPILMPDSLYIPYMDICDAELEARLIKELNSRPEWKLLISQKKMAVGIVDLSDPEVPLSANINGNHMMYAASLPKIAVLLAAMDAFDKGEVKETIEVKKDLRIMISKSSNEAATRMIDLLGFAKIEEVMLDPKYAFYDKATGGGLWVGKRYGAGSVTNREPMKHLSHAATTNQVCRLYYELAFGRLVNKQRSKQMLDILENPELHHKFVNSVELIDPKARMFRKSGSWKNFHADSILVWSDNPKRRYILVALIDDLNGEQIVRDLVKPLEKVIGIR